LRHIKIRFCLKKLFPVYYRVSLRFPFAALVAHRAACLASRLAGRAALSAARSLFIFVQLRRRNNFNVFHTTSEKINVFPINYNIKRYGFASIFGGKFMPLISQTNAGRKILCPLN
jgi:hypothetical protein